MAFIVSQKMDALERQSGYSVNTFTITDLSNYVSEGLDVNDFIGVLKIVFNSNTIYDNTNYDNPDISVGLGSKTFPLVLNSNGSVMLGTYQIALSIKNENTEEITTNTTTYTYNYEALELSILLEANGYESTLTSQDVTDYGTISVSRTHVLTIPIGSGLVDQTTTSSTISLPADIWSGEYETTLTNILTHVNGSLTVVDEVVQSETLMVYNLSRDVVFEAVSNFNELYNETIGVNPKLAVEYGILSNRINGYLREYQNGVEENDGTKCYNALTEIAELLSPDFIDDLFVTTEEIIPFDFRIVTDAQMLAFFQSLTATSTEINRLHGLSVSGNRVVYTDGTKLTSKSDFTFDGQDLAIPERGEIKVGSISVLDVLKADDNTWTGENTFENLASPVMTGIPVAPTASVDTNTTQVATTEYVIGQASSDTPLMNGIGNSGTSKKYARKDHVHPSDIAKAPIDSPTFTGDPKAPTVAKTDNDTSIATTAFVHSVVADYAALASPALTGSPTAPTQAPGDDSTSIATTEYVEQAAAGVKYELGLYQDFPKFNMTVIRNQYMDNSLNTYGKKLFKVITSGAFTSDMIGVRFKCTNAGTGTIDFQKGTTVILRTAGGVDVAANTPLVLNTIYTVVSANEPDSWGSTELTPYDGIESGKWYMVRDDTVTYNGNLYAASTYDPHAENWQDGENLSPVVFKGAPGYTTYTGNGFVYELNYMVVETSTGNGTTSGTITLNWLPNIYSLFYPETGKEWALKKIYPRDKTLKITGGSYADKKLNFVVSGTGGYTVFSNTDFALGTMVSLYNPFSSTFDVTWDSTFIPVSKPTYGNKYILGSGLFKRKTDGHYCGILCGVNTTDSRQRLGYFTTPDFETITMSTKPFLDGKLTDTYQSSGNLTVGYKYKIIATETNHFGSGLVVGDFFVATGTTACDANNIVRVVGDTWFWVGQVSAPLYVGQASDGSYLWECFSAFANAALNDTRIAVIRFDETFADQHLKVIDIDIPTILGDANETGVKYLQYPNYVYYDGKHRLMVSAPTDNLITHPWKTYEYISDYGKYGRYSTRTVIHDRDVSSLVSDTYPVGRDIELFKPFVYNSKLWALASGTAESSYCGFDANKREISLFRYSDEDNKWVLDGRSPVIINPIYATSTLWGSQYEWAQVHCSTIAPMIDGGIMYFMLSAEESKDTYQTTYGTLDLTVLSGN